MKATTVLKPLFNDDYLVFYEPRFTHPDKTTFSLFQVVFAVGPGDDFQVRLAVHDRFERVIALLAKMPPVRQSEVFTLRVRRRVPGCNPMHPPMFIECRWSGKEITEMFKNKDFSNWYAHCDCYINRFDDHDVWNKFDQPTGSNP